MPLNETVNLNITEAQRQISVLESQLDQLSRPITVPVNVQGGGELDAIRSDLGSSEGAAAELNRELSETDDALRNVARDAKRAGDDIDKAAKQGKTGFGNLTSEVKLLAGAFAGVAGARAVINFLGEAVTSASNLEQSVGALDAVFGEMSDELVAFGQTADQSVGLAASQFNQLASVLGSQLQTFGFNVADAATETQNLITLASDLAATFGGPVSQAVEAISSLLRGEVNPIERYGVAMNEAAIQSRALEDGLAATASELTFQDKTMARLAILYEQTANAQGQFGREADTTAGQLERLNAEFENTRAEIGEAVVPAFQQLLTSADQLIPVLEDLAPVVGLLAEAGIGVVTSFEPILDLFGLLAQPVKDVIDALNEANEVEGDGLENVSASARDLIENTQEALPLLEELTTLVSTGFDSSQMRQFFTDLGNSVAGGVDPLVAAEQAIKDFAAEGTLTEEVLLAIVETAGLLPGQIEAIRDAAQTGNLGFLTPEELRAIVLGLEDFAQVGEGAEVRGAQIAEMFRLIASGAQVAAGEIPTIQEIGASIAVTVRELEQFGLQDFSKIGQVDFDNPFAQLPTELELAGEAMKTEEGEIVDDFSDFVDNLIDQIEAQNAFADNIATLFDLGHERLAQSFLEAGIESAGLLADGLTDPAELARAEAELDAAAAELAISEVDAFAATVQGQLDGVNLTPIPVKIIPDFSDFIIPGSTLQGVGSTGTSDLVGGSVVVDVNITNEGFNPSTVDQAKQAQIINSVVTGQLN